MQSGIATTFEATEFAGISTRILNDRESPYTVLDMTIRPGLGAPAHISFDEDKFFLVLSGRLKYLVGDKTEIAEPGARIQVAKGVTHGFTNVGGSDARHLLISTPRYHEEFFRSLHNAAFIICRDMSRLHEERMALLPEVAEKHNQKIVGPLP